MTNTKGNIIVEQIKIGDIHYEFEGNFVIKTKVITLPIRHNNFTPEEGQGGYWTWNSEIISDDKQRNGEIVRYGVTEGLAHYGPNLYDYEAYVGCKFI